MARQTPLTIPAIDERIEFAGTSRLRDFNAEELNNLGGRVIVIQDGGGNRLGALMSYDLFLMMAKAAAANA